jgi:Leucine-rich repeat (LRR) protein
MRYCQIFKKRIEELKTKAESLEGLLLEYRKTGKEEIAEEIEKELEKNLKEIEKFKEEFTLKVKELLEKWYPKKWYPKRLNEFLQDIKINEKGRVEIEKLDVSWCNLSSLYLPSLFEKIKRLDCSFNELQFLPKLPDGLERLNCSKNQLQSLPELPDSLKELYCSQNKLTSLPKLPDGLKELWCHDNPLSKETIKRIKSHPNYNPKTWKF